MNMHRKTSHKAKRLFGFFTLCTLFLLAACGKGNVTSSQARSDLTADHIRGLYSGMMRNDIEDLLGTSDSSLAAKETVEVYSLADGSTAVLRYHEDTLRSAYIRDKDNNETPLFGYNTPNNASPNNTMNESDALTSSPSPIESSYESVTPDNSEIPDESMMPEKSITTDETSETNTSTILP